MDSDEEERLRQWKEHLAAQRDRDTDDSDHENHFTHPVQPQGAEDLQPSARGTSARRLRSRGSDDDLRDSLAPNAPDSQSIDWATALMPQMRQMQARSPPRALGSSGSVNHRAPRRAPMLHRLYARSMCRPMSLGLV